MDAELLAEIMRMLGKLEEGQRHSSESRRRLYEKLEKIEVDISIAAKVAAQARDKADAVEATVARDVKPVTDEIKRLRLMGAGGFAVVAVVFTALGLNAAPIAQGIRDFLASLFR